MAKQNNELTIKNYETEVLSQVNKLEYSGFEDMDQTMLSKPFLKVDSKTGNFINSVTEKSYGNKLKVLILGWDKSYVEWGNGALGDFRGIKTVAEVEELLKSGQIQKNKFAYETGNGSTLQLTCTLFCILPDHLEDGILFWSFKSTSIKLFNRWLSIANGQNIKLADGSSKKADIYTIIWDVNTILTGNKKGQWYAIGEDKPLVNRVGDIFQKKNVVVKNYAFGAIETVIAYKQQKIKLIIQKKEMFQILMT